MVVFRISAAEKSFSCFGRRKKKDCYLLPPPPPPSPLYHHLLHFSSFFSYHCSSCHATANEFLYFIEFEYTYVHVFVCFWWSKKKIQGSRNDWLYVAPLYPKGSIILGVVICFDGFITDLPKECIQRTRVVSCTYICTYFYFCRRLIWKNESKSKVDLFRNCIEKNCLI